MIAGKGDILMATVGSASNPVAIFQADLRSLPIEDVIRKHISTGRPISFSDDEYFELRNTVSTEFQLHPSSVVVVGSTRIGFSLNSKHRYLPVRTNSDIDVAIISQECFDDYWERVFRYAKSNIAWEAQGKFKSDLFNGWIDPRFLPSARTFDAAVRWSRFFDDLMQSRKYGRRSITARLYRSWSRLEAYQERSVLACKASLGISK
jgi:hypothetical protein